MEIAKFVPSEMRMKIVRDIIEKIGIRPVSNSVGVNSKTVYKYKLREAVPKDETFAKLLELLRERDPPTFDKYVRELEREFFHALGLISATPKIGNGWRETPLPPQARAEQKGEVKRSEIEVSRFEIYERLGIQSPLERMGLAKILGILQGLREFRLEDLERKIILPRHVVEKYVEMLVKHGYLRETPRGTYEVLVRLKFG